MQTIKTDSLLKAKGINFSYGQKSVLTNIKFTLKAGEVVGIAGESGSGKTTLLKVLSAKLVPQSGEVFFKNENIYAGNEQLLRGHDSIKIVDQDFDLMPYITVDENIIRNSLSLSENGRKRLLKQMKSHLNLKDVGSNKAVNTSGGQKQRIALATAVATKPDVLLLDEPFANLDYSLKVQAIQLLKSEWRAKAMVVVAHEPADLLSLCDRLVIMKKGKIVQQGKSKEVYQNPKNRYVAELLGPINVLNPELVKALKTEKKLVRPHELSFAESGISVEITNLHYCGGFTEVGVYSSEYEQTLITQYFGKGDLEEGQKVKLTYSGGN
ncbi:ABC transporter ATP-binding protein [Owenweeksia hongkongensis]|uniref:ABC transporter ATP-binding protein n=1 Tax=Owenweeksia hongkongensis TaxID=253245 RepID=UPI003A8F5CAB